MAVLAASATVKVACRISDSRNTSRGISEGNLRVSRNNSSISRGTSESSPRISSDTSNISDRAATAVPAVSAATSATAARAAFTGMGSITRLFQVWPTRVFSIRVP